MSYVVLCAVPVLPAPRFVHACTVLLQSAVGGIFDAAKKALEHDTAGAL